MSWNALPVSLKMKTYYYVYEYLNRAPVVRHPDFETARAEAERLAEKHPGRCFEILKALGYATTSKGTTKMFSEKDDTPEKPNTKESEADEGGPSYVGKTMTKMIDKNGVVLRAGDLFEYQLRGTVATGCVEIRDGAGGFLKLRRGLRR